MNLTHIAILKWTLISMYLVSIPLDILMIGEPREPKSAKIVAISTVIGIVIIIWVWSVLPS